MNEFEQIINQAIAAAEEVDCSEDDFKLGLALMYHTLKERLNVEDIDPADHEVLEKIELMERV